MALSRTLPNPADGAAMFGHIQEQLAALFARAPLVPTSITNSGNDYTIVVDPALNAGLINGMSFWIQPSTTNTGAARLRVTTGGTYYNLTDVSGAPLVDGAFDASTWYLVTFLGGNFLSINLSDVSGYSPPDTLVFIASGTLDLVPYKAVKPDKTRVDVLVIAAGGSGGRVNLGGSPNDAGGGGGGSSIQASFNLGDLPDTIGITIGAGGTAISGTTGTGNQGGTTSFGSIISIPGGPGGDAGSWGLAASTGTIVFDKSLVSYGVGTGPSAGTGGDVGVGSTAAGTTSIYFGDGGNGGSNGVDGTAPGGGGGAGTISGTSSGAGARGEIRVHIGE